jgi:hypothetical protein
LKDHFSSNGTSRVLGGENHEFVVELLDMLARKDGQAYHGVLVDAEPASGLTKATTLLQMLEYRQGFVLGEFGVVEWDAFTFGEACHHILGVILRGTNAMK